MTKCCYSYNSMCSCTLGCMPVCWTLFHSHAAHGVWGLGHVFEGKLYFTKDIVDDSFVPKGTKLKAVPEPAVKPAPKAAPKPAPKGKHVQLFKMKRKAGKGFYSVPVNQNESD